MSPSGAARAAARPTAPGPGAVARAVPTAAVPAPRARTAPDGPPAAAPDTAATLRRCRDLVRPALSAAVAGLHPWPAAMAAHAFGWAAPGHPGTGAPQGKGVRPALAVLAAEAVGAPGTTAVPGAVAAELVHTFSLMHDDVMDRDATRRGRPAVWAAYGTGPAVLAGDALFALAVGTLSAAPGPRTAPALRQLSGALNDLIRGQADDLLFETRPWTGAEAVGRAEYLAMAEGKTGALLGCAAALGALLGGAPPATAAALDRFGRHLGTAFQVADDVLGLWGTPEATGKPVHADLLRAKKTLPVLAALESGGPDARALAALLAAPGPLTPEGAARAAALAARAGGREAALAEARRRLALADTCLDGVPLRPGAVRELRALRDFLVHRSC